MSKNIKIVCLICGLVLCAFLLFYLHSNDEQISESIYMVPQLYRGLSITNAQQNLSEKLQLQNSFDSKKSISVPFTYFSTSIHDIDLKFTPENASSMLIIDGYAHIFNNMSGIPVKCIFISKNLLIVIFKSIPDNSMWIINLDVPSKNQVWQNVRRGPAELIFRAATNFEDKLYIVWYDNSCDKNFLYSYNIALNTIQQFGEEISLPGLKDSAAIYEIIPSIFIKATGNDEITIVGGTLIAKIDKKS